MTKLNVYERLLYTLVTNNMVAHSAILVISDTAQPVYSAIREASRNNHLRKTAIKFKIRGVSYSETYLSITASGVRYLVEQCSSKIPWLSFVPPSQSRINIRAQACATSTIERFLRITTASVISASIGAFANPVFLARSEAYETPKTFVYDDVDSTDDNSLTEFDINCEAECDIEDLSGHDLCNRNSGVALASIVHNAIRKYQAKGQTQNSQKKEISDDVKMTFHNSFEIKTAIEQLNNDSKYKNYDSKFGRYSGLLESCFKSVLLYSGSIYGFSWPERVVSKEISVFKQFDNLVSEYGNIRYNDIRGGILVQNAKMFADIYQDRHGRRKREKDELLGRSFTHFYIIPVSGDGKKMLKEIMTTDETLSRQFIIDSAIDSGLFSANTTVDAEFFPIRNSAGTLFMLGMEMNAIAMQKLEAITSRFTSLDYGILCRPWQIEYYKRVFPKAKYMTVE